jgi:type VI secretion system secreted protein VgrG
MSIIFRVQIHFATTIEINDYDKLIGSESLLTILNDYDEYGDTDRYFHGIIRKLEYVGADGDYFLYEAEMVPKFWQLSLRKNCRIFQETTTQEIVKKLLEEGGIDSEHYRFALINEKRDRGFCVQYNESNFDFISRLLEEEGIYYFFEHYKDKHVMVMCDDKTMHSPIQGDKSIVFNPGGMEGDEESIYSFTFSQRMRSGEYTHRNFFFKRTTLDLTAKESAPNKESFEVYEYPSLHTTQERGNELAKARSEELAAMQKQGNGCSTSCRLIPGYTFTLFGHDSKVLNTDYLITSTVFSGEQPQSLEEGNGDGFLFDVEFTVIPASAQFRPARTREKPFVKGLQTATVVGPEGAEINTDEYGRVRVQFHWDREGKRDDRSSCWIRVGQAWGGLSRGAQYIPRIGDEVLVDFLEGDPDRPIITGSVYNSDNMPINSLKKSITQSGFRTKTHKGKGFHELRFDDAKGKEEIYLQSEKDWNINIKNRKGQTVGGDSGTVIAKNCDQSVGGDSYTIVTGKSTEIAKEIIIGTSDKITIVSGGSSIVISPAGVEINGAIVKVNCGGGASMPAKRPVTGNTGKGGSSGGGGGKSAGGGASSPTPASGKPSAAAPSTTPAQTPETKAITNSAAPPGTEKPLDTFKGTVPSGGWKELDSAGSVPEYDGWTLGPVSQGASGLGDLVSSGSSSPLLKGAGLPGAGDLVSSATSSLPGDLKNRVSQVASVLQNPASLKDTAVNEGKNRLNRELNNAKDNLLEKTGIGEAQNEANQELNKLRDLLKSPRIKQEDLLKKF